MRARRQIKNFFAGIFSLVLGGFVAWWMGPMIWNDLAIDKASFERAPEYAMTEGACETKYFILGSCDLRFVHQQTGEKLNRDFFAFGDFSGEEVYALKSPEGYVTSNIGLDVILSRVVMFGFLLLLFLGGGLVLLHKLVRGRAKS